MSFETRGTNQNPYHLSMAAVIEDNGKFAIVKKSSGYFTLMRETPYSNESIEDAVTRGASEEIGVLVKVHGFIGNVLTEFSGEDGTPIDKTTLYFYCTTIKATKRNPEQDEINDEILWVSKSELENKLRDCHNHEYKLIERL